MRGEFSLTDTTKGSPLGLPFVRKIKLLRNEILGKDYNLSVALVDKKKSQELNKLYRKKNKPTNVLSFTLTKKSGELVLCPDVIKKEEKKFDKKYLELFGYLVIHGMLHLKGYLHSSKMDKAEEKYDKKYFYKYRPRIRDDESHRGRIHKGRKKS